MPDSKIEVAEEGTEETQTPEAESTESNLVRLKRGGKEFLKTQEEVEAAAQQWFDGDNKSVSAKKLVDDMSSKIGELESQAKLGSMFQRAITKPGETPNTEAQKELLGALGYSEEQTAAYLAELHGQVEGTEAPTGGTEKMTQVETKMAELAEVNQALRAKVEELDKESLGVRQTRIQDQVRERVDNDEILGKLTKKAGPRAEKVRKMVWKAVVSAAQEAQALRKGDGPEVVEECIVHALAEVRADLDDLDIRIATPGLGLAPGLDTSLRVPDEEPKAVSVTDPNYAENLLARMAFGVQQAGE